jgi:hypothetical protein
MMKNTLPQTASASGEANILDGNQPQIRLPREDQNRAESDKEFKAFLDEKQLLTRLPISRRTLGNWKAKGWLPHIKIGRRCLYDWQNVHSALLRRERGGIA